MMKTLPRRPNLDHLRQQAKDLLTDLRRDSVERSAMRLHHAQRLLAQQYGFPSWPALKTDVESALTAERYVRRWNRTFGAGIERPVPGVMCEGMLRHPNPWVRWQCASLLIGVVDPASVPAVVAALRDPVPRVRKHALSALISSEQKLGVDIVPVLIERARRDDNDHVRMRFIGALVERRAQPRVAEALARIAVSDRHPVLRDVAAGRASLKRGWKRVLADRA